MNINSNEPTCFRISMNCSGKIIYVTFEVSNMLDFHAKMKIKPITIVGV